jgi:hypothetical protein
LELKPRRKAGGLVQGPRDGDARVTGTSLLRMSGIGLMLAAPLGIAGALLHPRSETLVDLVGSNTTASHLLFAAAFALIMITLPGLFAAHAARSGILGLVGYVALMLLCGYHLYLLLYEAGPVAALSRDPESERLFAPGGAVPQGTLRAWGSPLGILAPILYGAALLRAGVRPRLAGWLVIAFVPAFFLATGTLALAPLDTRQSLIDVGFTPIGLAVSYGLLLSGLAIPGYQLWRTARLELESSRADPSSSTSTDLETTS